MVKAKTAGRYKCSLTRELVSIFSEVEAPLVHHEDARDIGTEEKNENQEIIFWMKINDSSMYGCHFCKF